jgi:hypothetical protein
LIGMRVRVREHHRMTERRGMVGKIVGYYGGADDYVAVEVRLSGGDCRLFWLGDTSPHSSTIWTSRTPKSLCCAAKTTRSLQPSARGVPPRRA